MHTDRITAIEALAETQYCLFTEAQAAAAGIDAAMLYRHTRPGGRWRRRAPRVYGLADMPDDWHRPIMAAALSLGDTGVPSHASAGALLRYDGVSHRQQQPEVIITDGNAGWGWRVHRRYQLPSGIVVTDGIPHTNARRTARDLCSVLDADHIEMMLESALRLGHMTLDDFEILAATKGWKGVRKLREVLERRPTGAAPTGSELETRYVQLVRLFGLPEPLRQYAVVLHGEVIALLDLAWPEFGLFVELDGGVHEQLAALRRDRQRQNDVVRILGWRPLRFTWDDVVRRPTVTGRVTLSAVSSSHRLAV